MNNFLDILTNNFAKEGFSLTQGQIEQFLLYKDMLVSWNKKINLTAIVDDEGIAIKHFLDSALILKYFDIKTNSAFLDVGAGAGFPSIPIKILRPDIAITMMDSLNKRIIFLNEVLAKLKIDASAIHMRAEDAALSEQYRESFDIVSARAVTKTRELAELSIPLVKVGGYFIPLKAGEIDAELAEAKPAIKALGGSITDVISYSLADDTARTIVVIHKDKKTLKKYPRSWGQIKKNPIK